MTTPSTDNKTADEVNDLIKNANSVGVQLLETLIIADFPILGWRIPRFFLNLALGWFNKYLIKAEETGATFKIVDTQIDSEESNISKELAALTAAEKSGDPNAIQAAIKAYSDAQSALIHDDGSASIH